MRTIKKILFLLLLLGTGFCIQQEITIEEAATLLSKDTLSGSIASDKAQQLLNTAEREIQTFLNRHLTLDSWYTLQQHLPFCEWAGYTPVTETDDYYSKNIYVLDRTTMRIMAVQASAERVPPASLTKLMTCLVAMENLDDLDESVTIQPELHHQMMLAGASLAGFSSNEHVTVRDLLYATMLASGAEAANSLALHISGSIPEFVELMNARAQSLGLKNTAFKNPEGLDTEGQYTTAEDIAKLLDYALENTLFCELLSTKIYKTSTTPQHPQGIRLVSTVLGNLTELEQDGFKIMGGKSGTTSQAGQCWAIWARKKQHEYIIVLLGAELNDIKHPDLKQKQDALKILQSLN